MAAIENTVSDKVVMAAQNVQNCRRSPAVAPQLCPICGRRLEDFFMGPKEAIVPVIELNQSGALMDSNGSHSSNVSFASLNKAIVPLSQQKITKSVTPWFFQGLQRCWRREGHSSTLLSSMTGNS